MGHPSLEILQAFLPALSIPPRAIPSVSIGFTILIASIFSTTWGNDRYILLRLALAPIAIYFFWDFGYGLYPTPTRGVEVGRATVTAYGMMRIIETTFVGLLDKKLPYWIKDGKEVPLPSTLMDRLAYSVDLATSLRGNSWFRGTSWDWAPKALVEYSPTWSMSRTRFVVGGIASLVQQFLALDVIDTIIKSRTWDTTNAYPITSLPIHEQLMFATCVCVQTFLAITFPYTFFSCTFVLLGSHPRSWPPMFDKPFTASSLGEFWARRWHAIFRRVFERLSSAILRILSVVQHTNSPLDRTRRTIRAIVVFSLSACVHILVMHRVDSTRGEEDSQAFLDPSTVMFFLSQPLGLVVEGVVIIPLCDAFLPKGWKGFVTRAWAWAFLLFSGRFWADVWLHGGMWGNGEKSVGFSVVRGMKYGNWKMV